MRKLVLTLFIVLISIQCSIGQKSLYNKFFKKYFNILNDNSTSTDNFLEKLIKTILEEIPKLKAEISKSLSQSTTSEVVKIVVSRGFTSFEEKTSVSEIRGVKKENLQKFVNHLKDSMKIPQDQMINIMSVISDIIYEKETTWIMLNLVFNINKGGTSKYVCILGRNNGENGLDFLIADVDSQFVMAPDLFIVNKKKSFMGNFFSDNKYVFKFVPRSLQTAQFSLLFDFFEVITFRRFAELKKIIPDDKLNNNIKF